MPVTRHPFRPLLQSTCLIIAALLALAGCSKSKEPAPAQQPAPAAMAPQGMGGPQTMGDQQKLAMGKAIFSKKCASCHGSEGIGTGPAGPALKGREYTYGKTAEAIALSIRNGRPKGMPAFGNSFQDIEVETLTAYLLSLK